MRSKLIQALRELELEHSFINHYEEFDKQHCVDYSITEYIEFPNYCSVINKFMRTVSARKFDGKIPAYSENSIKAELTRMNADGLVIIGTQEGEKTAVTEDHGAPDYDEGTTFTTESIVLTTKAKNRWRYAIHKAWENPVSIIISIIALIISIVIPLVIKN